jgi:hypothetical protein
MFLTRIASRGRGIESAHKALRSPAFANAPLVERASLARPTSSGGQHRAPAFVGQEFGELSRAAVLESGRTA